MPMRLWKGKKGDIYGDHWISRPSEKQGGRFTLIDTNYWKSQHADSLTVPDGDRSAFMLPGSKPEENRLFIDHFLAQKRDRVFNEKDSRGVDIWSKKPEKFDDHLWDSGRLARVATSVVHFSRLQDPRNRIAAHASSTQIGDVQRDASAATKGGKSQATAAAPARSRSKVSYPGF
jgi:hypothetical protein